MALFASGQVLTDRCRTTRLSNRSDAIWVTAKLSNVLLNPFKREALIEEASVRGTTLFLEVAATQPTIRADLVDLVSSRTIDQSRDARTL